jgi:thiomorpholine-carboxylate dehydrogenase
MSNTIPYYSEQDIAGALAYSPLIELMARTLSDFSNGHAIQPVRQMLEVEPQQRYLGIMPAVLPESMGAKLVCFYPGNAGTEFHTHLASIALFDPVNGQPLAFMDGRLITEMRTAATSAAVTRVAANPNSKSLALIGSGVQAKAHLLALQTLYDLQDVRVWSPTKEHASAFAAAHKVTATTTIEAAVANADIVVCATNSKEPLLQGAWLKPGAHVNSVGSPRPDWRELDDAVMRNQLIVDSRDAAQKESGDVILSNAAIYAEAGEVLSAQKAIDRTDTTVFKSVGIAVEDLATARLVFELLNDDSCAY